MTTEPKLPSLRELSPERRRALETCLLDEIRLDRPGRPIGARRVRPQKRLFAAAVAVVAVAGVVPALALSTTLRNLVGLGVAPRHQLYYGMTPNQVQKVAGRPKTKRAGCWYYPIVRGRVGSLIVGVPGSISYRTATQLRLCFYSGSLNTEFVHRLVAGEGYRWISVNL